MKVRAMQKEDWEQVYHIYHQGMKTNLATFSVEVLSYEMFDDSRLKAHRWVMIAQNEVLAWATLKLAYEQIPEYNGVAEVSIYVDENHQGKGIASKLLKHTIEASEKDGYWMLQSDIFSNNKSSIALHKKCGFRMVGYREKIGKDKKGTWRDTVLLERRSKHVGCE